MLNRNAAVMKLFVTISALSYSLAAKTEIPGFYAGFQLGYANNHLDTSRLVNVTYNNNSVQLPGLNNILFAYRFSIGYQFNSYWAIELGYRHFVNSDMSIETPSFIAHASSKENAYELTGKGIIPLDCKFSLYGKLGIAYLKPNTHGNASTVNPYTYAVSSYSNTLEPVVGFGLSYAIKPNVPIDFSYQRLQKLGGNSAPSSDFYAIGVSYYFG